LCRIDRGVQLRSLRSLHDAGVVPGGQPVEAELDHARQHQVEAHEGVASHAGVRSATLEVIAVEGLDDSLAEFLLEVPAVIRNAYEARHATRVLDGVERAASAVARGLDRVIAWPLLQGDADDVVPLALEQRGSDGRIDTARHGDGDFHRPVSWMSRGIPLGVADTLSRE